MAGSYPDVPGQRMAYDRDGTVGFYYESGVGTVTTLTGSQMEALNNESTGGVAFTGNDKSYVTGIVFPELRDVVGVLTSMFRDTAYTDSYYVGNMETSTDTTNGYDGTWTSQGLSSLANTTTTKADLRDNITSVSWSGVKGVRFGLRKAGSVHDTYIYSFHLFGTPSSGEAPDRLLFIDPSTSSEVGGAFFDLGDIARSSTSTVDFQVKNPSSTLTANTVTVTMEALTDTSPSNVGQFEFSTDGGSSWSSTASLGNLSSGSTSTTVTLRRNTSGSAALSLWWTRMVASASSWS